MGFLSYKPRNTLGDMILTRKDLVGKLVYNKSPICIYENKECNQLSSIIIRRKELYLLLEYSNRGEHIIVVKALTKDGLTGYFIILSRHCQNYTIPIPPP